MTQQVIAQKIATMKGLLPSQRQWLERFAFQIEFNRPQLIEIIGGPGSGKSTLCLSIAELLSTQYNIALLTVEAHLTIAAIRQHLLEHWFGFAGDGRTSLTQTVAERRSAQPLALVLDHAEQLPPELWPELRNLPCLIIAAVEQGDAGADVQLRLPELSLDDAEQLLHGSGFSTLSVAERLEQAQSNIHLLLNPQQRQSAATPSFKTYSLLTPVVVFMLGFAVIASVVGFWWWSEQQRLAHPNAQTLTYLPEPEPMVVKTPAIPSAEVKANVDALVAGLESAPVSNSQTSVLAKNDNFDTVEPAQAQPESAAVTTPETVTTDSIAAEDTQVADGVSANMIVDEATQQPQMAIKNNDTQSLGAAVEVESSTSQPTDIAAEMAAESLTTSTSTADADLLEDAAAELAATDTTTTETNVAETRVRLDNTQHPPAVAATASASESSLTARQQKAAANGYAYGEAELLSMSGQQYALQLVVFSNDAALRSFQQTFAQFKTLTYVRQKNGQRQLVVVLAPFADAQMARQKRQTLPPALANAFVKPLADIHSEISTQ
jgi:septal ring-binding cell division protein DamX